MFHSRIVDNSIVGVPLIYQKEPSEEHSTAKIFFDTPESLIPCNLILNAINFELKYRNLDSNLAVVTV